MYVLYAPRINHTKSHSHHPHRHHHPPFLPQKRYPYNDARTVGPPLRAKAGPFFEPRMGRYAFRFPGSDSAVVKASQRMVHAFTFVPIYVYMCVYMCIGI